jgi:hypothetical protein
MSFLNYNNLQTKLAVQLPTFVDKSKSQIALNIATVVQSIFEKDSKRERIHLPAANVIIYRTTYFMFDIVNDEGFPMQNWNLEMSYKSQFCILQNLYAVYTANFRPHQLFTLN